MGWLTCPVREVMADRHLVRVLDLRSQAKLAPISGWPQRYGAWAPQLLTLLEPPSVQPEAGEP